MKDVLRMAAFVALLSSYSHAQVLGTIGGVQPNGWAKAENGMILSWHSMARDTVSAQVDVSNRYGNHLVSLSLLRLVPEAATVDISDGSAVPGLIAHSRGLPDQAGFRTSSSWVRTRSFRLQW